MPKGAKQEVYVRKRTASHQTSNETLYNRVRLEKNAHM